MPPSSPYFTLAFFRSSRITIKEATRKVRGGRSQRVVPPSRFLTFSGQAFPNSEMGRDLIKVSATVDGASQDCLFMTAHLESLGDKRNSGKR